MDKIAFSTERRIKSPLDTAGFIIVNEIQQLNPKETAIIICDMWNRHWCKGATARVAEMTPRLNEVITAARSKGMLIVHAPSDCIDYYKGHPARKRVLKYSSKKYEKRIDNSILDSEKDAVWPIDQSDEGCDDAIKCQLVKFSKKEIEGLLIDEEKDAISDSGAEMAALFDKKGIKNVILTGVHTNMCIIGRTFGLRSMVRLGKNVMLMRDMTDAMYNSKMHPVVNHFTGVSFMVEYIEKYVCPTILSTDLLGGKQFRFSEDKRPLVAFITAEGEYRSNQRLPEFADDLMLHHGLNCEFAIGKPAMDGPGRNNIENLQILNDADLAVFFTRRVALEPQKMELVKKYVERGKPVLGIRTASHSFSPNDDVLNEKVNPGQTKESAAGFLSRWIEFDRDVLGGNYQGHYPVANDLIKIDIVPGMENHPLLKNIPVGGFSSPCTLYKNRPLSSPNDQVLLMGSISGQLPEPVLWTNTTANNNKVIYTSLGHPEDWKNDAFHNLMINSVNYLLGSENIKR
ncbi:MAG: isochorismatase family protein [Chitinophagaceae bacterium]|nr:isochorismatase family protein [Chitinophagaceae bacterium]